MKIRAVRSQCWKALALLFLFVVLLGLVPGVAAQSPPPPTVIIAPGSAIEIAVAVDMTGPTSQIGLDGIDAINLAVDEYGPIKGFSVQVNAYDAGCDGTMGQAAALAVLANPQHVGVIGHTCSGSTNAGLDDYEAALLPVISATSSSVALPAVGPTVFNRVIVTDAYGADPGGRWFDTVTSWPQIADFKSWFNSEYGRTPDTYAFLHYDAMMLMLDNIEEVSTVDGGGNLVVDRAVLASAIRATYGEDDMFYSAEMRLEPDGERFPDLLGTGGMEIDVDGDKVPEGWKLTSPSGKSKIKCNKPADGKYYSNFGDCAFLFKSTGAKEKLEYTFNVPGGGSAGDSYALALYVSGTNVPLNAGTVKIIAKDASGNKEVLGTFNLPNGTFAYMSLGGTYVTTMDYEKIKITISYAGGGKLFVDDVTLVQVVP
jgi:hypothetical protein